MIRSFVACEVGFWEDPPVQTFARSIGDAQGGAFILRLREMVRRYGATDGRLIRPDGGKYSAAEISAYVRWPGRNVRKLIAAFDAAGVLRCRRGCFYYPGWRETITGAYVSDLDEEASYRRELRRRKRATDMDGVAWEEKGDVRGDVRGTSGGRPGDVPVTSLGMEERSKERTSVGPPGAPHGGEREAVAVWFLETYPRVRNHRRCRQLLAGLTDEEVAQLRYGLGQQAPTYLSKKNKKGWRFVPFADTYLERGIFWEFRPPKAAELAPTNGHAEKAAELERERVAHEAERMRMQLRAQVISRLLSEGVRKPPLNTKEWEAFDARVEEEMARTQPAPSGPPS